MHVQSIVPALVVVLLTTSLVFPMGFAAVVVS